MRDVERDQFWFREHREIVLEVKAWGSLPQDMREEIKLEVYPAKTGIGRTSDGTTIEGERQKDNGYLAALSPREQEAIGSERKEFQGRELRASGNKESQYEPVLGKLEVKLAVWAATRYRKQRVYGPSYGYGTCDFTGRVRNVSGCEPTRSQASQILMWASGGRLIRGGVRAVLVVYSFHVDVFFRLMRLLRGPPNRREYTQVESWIEAVRIFDDKTRRLGTRSIHSVPRHMQGAAPIVMWPLGVEGVDLFQPLRKYHAKDTCIFYPHDISVLASTPPAALHFNADIDRDRCSWRPRGNLLVKHTTPAQGSKFNEISSTPPQLLKVVNHINGILEHAQDQLIRGKFARFQTHEIVDPNVPNESAVTLGHKDPAP
ncbi:hypothetical protein K438DRAFT_2051446 [Mycena galopus ATCC 62051]|nr:hypothetical protein K438DRAFT_2051446 [Mycena galopus ATCC 62051]